MSKKVVRVRRRRRAEPSETGERERAEAPRRRRREDSKGAARPPARRRPSRPTGSAPQIPLGGGRLSLPMLLGILGILVICVCLYLFVLAPSGPDDSFVVDVATQSSDVSRPTIPPAPTRTPRPFTPPAVSSEAGQTWLVMLYQDADDKVLEQDIYLDLNEAERVGSNEQLHIVAQVDRFRAGYRGDGDWSDSIREGDQVTLWPYSECGVCPACHAGRPNTCQFNETLGLQRDGALSERFAVHYSRVFASKLLTLKELALVEPMSVGYHAANRGEVSEVDTVLVIGCGTIGMGVIAAAVRKGANVIVADIDDGKLAQATRFGAQHTVNSTDHDVLTEMDRLTAGDGVDVAIEAVGLPETFRLAVDAVCYAGRVVYVGYAKQEVCYDTTVFVRKELDIRGSRNALRVFPAVIKMLEGRRQPFEDLITKVYPFEQTAEALRDWDANPGAFTKIMIHMLP